MSRGLNTAMTTVTTDSVVRPCYFLDLAFVDSSNNASPLYFWTGFGSLTANNAAGASVSYQGAGDLLSISPIEESQELQANGLTLTLTGVKSSLVTVATTTNYQGREATIRLGALDTSNDLIASPEIIFEGFMDVMTISDQGDLSTIQMTVENKLIGFDREKPRYYTAEDQKYIGSLGLPITTAGSFATDTTYKIIDPGNTDFQNIGASANTAGIEFEATGSGAGNGTAQIVDLGCQYVASLEQTNMYFGRPTPNATIQQTGVQGFPGRSRSRP
jgi:hypothetical protein